MSKIQNIWFNLRIPTGNDLFSLFDRFEDLTFRRIQGIQSSNNMNLRYAYLLVAGFVCSKAKYNYFSSWNFLMHFVSVSLWETREKWANEQGLVLLRYLLRTHLVLAWIVLIFSHYVILKSKQTIYERFSRKYYMLPLHIMMHVAPVPIAHNILGQDAFGLFETLSAVFILGIYAQVHDFRKIYRLWKRSNPNKNFNSKRSQ